MKFLSGMIAAILSGTSLFAAEDHLIGHWDFADAAESTVPGKAGPAGKIMNYGKGATLIKLGNKTLLKVTGSSSKDAGGFAVPKLDLDPTKAFTVIFDFFFEQQISDRKTRDFFSFTDSDKGPGFRFFYGWGALSIRTGDGEKVLQKGSKRDGLSIPAGRIARLAVVYDEKTAVFYLDGKKIAENEFRILPCKRRTLLFGRYWHGSAYPLNGALGSIKVYNKALGAAEIAEDYLTERENLE